MIAFPPQAVVFDMDGVILDSFEANIAYYNFVSLGLGLGELNRHAQQVVHRETHVNALKHIAGEKRFQEALDLSRQYKARQLQKNHSLFPQGLETIARLSKKVPLAVGTNRDHSTYSILHELEVMDFFGLVVTPSDAPAPKPAAVFMEYLLGKLGYKPDQVVYIGDSLVDQLLCDNAGVRLLAFRNPELSAWRHVEEFARIPEALGFN